MNLKTLLVILSLAASGFAQSQCNQRDPKTTEGLLAVENRWVEALDRRDQRVACILAPEFKDQGVNGEQRDRKKVLADVPRRHDAQQHLQDLEPIVLGDAGLVRGVNHLTTSDGKAMADVRFTDVFVYREGRWQAVSAQETLVRLENH